MKQTARIAFAALCAAGFIAAQRPSSPPAEASTTINGKTITIKYSAPSVRGRQIFGDGGLISHDPTYPVWRLGANSATALTTTGNLDINGLKVPAGSYTLFALVGQGPEWSLIVSKKTGEWGLAYDPGSDLGRVKMNMSKPPSPVETFKITIDHTGGNHGKFTFAWADQVASVPFTVE